MRTTLLSESIARQWNESILDRLMAYVRLPNKSPAFDEGWQTRGYMEAAVNLMADWCRAQPIPGMRVEIRRLPGLTPLLLVDIPGELDDCVLLYGHLDKQPEFSGWSEGLAPWEPVIRDGKLYGRGAADDGYALFDSLAAIVALKEQGVAMARCVVLVEASEESGSIHLPAHLDALGARIGSPSLVICLDAECGNYEQLWCTSSLRGGIDGVLHVRTLSAGVHSGMGGGIAPAPFRIAQTLLARVEHPETGAMLLEELQAQTPSDRRAQLALAARTLGAEVAGKLPFANGVQPLSSDPQELLNNNTWRAALTVIGADGMPAAATAGNVLLPSLSLRLSMRIPPTCDPLRAAEAMRLHLERDPPYGAIVRFDLNRAMEGWNAPSLQPWLEHSLTRASEEVFGRTAVHVGCGGTIPFMGMLARRFPHAQFFVTGVLGPHSNAHGPDEFLDLEYAQRLAACVAIVLADHGRRFSMENGA